MFTDLLGEIYVSMSRNKMRIALTGFSIAWGIFMLIVLLGAGNGLLNGVMSNMGNNAHNTVSLWPGYTSLPYHGMPKDRQIHFEMSDIEFLKNKFPDVISSISPRISTSVRASIGQEYCQATLNGFYPEYRNTSDDVITAGRTINEIDIAERRKVCVLSRNAAEMLHLDPDSEADLGRWIDLYDIPFQVIGFYRSRQNYDRDQTFIAPITTVSTIFKPDGYYGQLKLEVQNLETMEDNERFNTAFREAFARHKEYDPNDTRALWTWNSARDYIETMSVFNAIGTFIWIIGLATLIAGITGISNIMLITVRERTREFGIRKALGASPASIVCLVLLESVAITLVFGYIGMMCGIGLTELIDTIISTNGSKEVSGEQVSMFLNPTVDLSVILAANAVMVIAGVIAGYVPAKRAVSIKPIEALTAN